jgi:hypothetical protein
MTAVGRQRTMAPPARRTALSLTWLVSREAVSTLRAPAGCVLEPASPTFAPDGPELEVSLTVREQGVEATLRDPASPQTVCHIRPTAPEQVTIEVWHDEEAGLVHLCAITPSVMRWLSATVRIAPGEPARALYAATDLLAALGAKGGRYELARVSEVG